MNEVFSTTNIIFSIISLIGVMLIIRPHRFFISDEGGIDINGNPYTHEGRILGVIAGLV